MFLEVLWEPMVLDRLIDRYCDFLRYEQRASPATCQQRYYALRRLYWFLAGLFGRKNIKVEEVQQQHLRSYLNYLHNQGCKPSTIGHVVTVVKALFRFAVAKKILRKNPAARLRKPRVPKREKPYLKPGEVEALFLAVEPGEANWRRNLTILLTFYYTGIRLEELLNLRLEDLSPDCSEMRIVRGKGDKSRLLPVHPVLQEALRLYLAKERVGGGGGVPIYHQEGQAPQPEHCLSVGEEVCLAGRVGSERYPPHFAAHLCHSPAPEQGGYLPHQRPSGTQQYRKHRNLYPY
jgi:site-specific recombinase XerD